MTLTEIPQFCEALELFKFLIFQFDSLAKWQAKLLRFLKLFFISLIPWSFLYFAIAFGNGWQMLLISTVGYFHNGMSPFLTTSEKKYSKFSREKQRSM